MFYYIVLDKCSSVYVYIKKKKKMREKKKKKKEAPLLRDLKKRVTKSITSRNALTWFINEHFCQEIQ